MGLGPGGLMSGSQVGDLVGFWTRMGFPMKLKVYLDETGTHESAERLMVGAVVVSDHEMLTRVVQEFVDECVVDEGLWIDTPEKVETFIARWPHYTEDNDTIRTLFTRVLKDARYRAYVCYSLRKLDLDDIELQTLMYHTLIYNLLQRYAGYELEFLFEANSSMNSQFGRIVVDAVEELRDHRVRIAEASVGIVAKPLAGLSVVDYVLATTEIQLATEAVGAKQQPAFLRGRPISLSSHVAHIIDFDAALHRRRFDRLL